MDHNKPAAPVGKTAEAMCDHFYTWVSPAGSSNFANLCTFCKQPNPEWLNNITEGATPEPDIQPLLHIRKPIYVGAVRVTLENMSDVALWCCGTVEAEPKIHIKFQPPTSSTARQTQAFVGDWVLQSISGFKVYTDQSFKRSFDEIDPKDFKGDPKSLPFPFPILANPKE